MKTSGCFDCKKEIPGVAFSRTYVRKGMLQSLVLCEECRQKATEA